MTEKENNKHNIEKIEDIFKVVNSNNKENFLKDFSNWLDLNISLKENVEKSSLKDVIKLPLNQFIWIDDGKNEMNLNIKLKEECKGV